MIYMSGVEEPSDKCKLARGNDLHMSGVEESSDKCKLARGNDLHEWGGGIFR